MKSFFFAAAAVLFALFVAHQLWLRTAFAIGPSACEDGPVPIVWPLGPTGFETRTLLTSHGQFLQFGSDKPHVHEGIDIAACIGDEVYAVADGTVVELYDDFGKGYGEVVIRDADNPLLGWTYVHLKEITVDTSEEKKQVFRGQFIGRVVDFPESIAFNHLHLERTRAHSDDKSVLGSHGAIARSADDPLNWLTPRADNAPPRRLAFGSPHPALAGYLFFVAGDVTALAPHELAGKDVEIVGRVSETFPGVAAPSCDPIAAACAGLTAPMEITPQRISFGIFHEREDPTGFVYPRTRVERVFHSVIDLSMPIWGVEVPASSTSTTEPRQVLADNVYREGSQGDYTERNFLIRLTNCQFTGSGSFKFEEPGEYLLQMVLEDASGNVDMFERTVGIP